MKIEKIPHALQKRASESPFQDIVLNHHLTNTTQFFAIWNVFKNTEDYGYLMNDDASKEAILIFEGLYETIKTTIEYE